MKVERVSYDVMTPSAARGILEAIYWTPAISWRITALHVLKRIQFQTMRRNEVGHKVPSGTVKSSINSHSLLKLRLQTEKDRQQRSSRVLKDVAYVIHAVFDITDNARDPSNASKHLEIFRRRARRGQCFHHPYLGMREFPASFELLNSDSSAPPPIEETRDLGLMLFDIDHAADKTPSFFSARMENGVMIVPPRWDVLQ